ncbi:putative sugar nucleotidyl transferase [Sphingobacterium sp. HJSM2_6]|uniref:putative sugar nucleotidyl transferase n=1 Tax=Sphingobacterium sp. HJSM2_6 TaxID=3366264 RepID=UPI003BB9D008
MFKTVVLFDHAAWRNQLLPLSATRPVGNLRVGICTLDKKWELLLGCPVTYATVPYLQSFEQDQSTLPKDLLIIKANVLPSRELLDELVLLQSDEVLMDVAGWVAFRSEGIPIDLDHFFTERKQKFVQQSISSIEHPEDIFVKNKEQLLFDFELLTAGRRSQEISTSNQLLGSWIFVEEGAKVEGSFLNSLEGPIYIGKNTIVEEGSFIRGYVAIGDHARVKMGSKIYPNVSIGPHSTVSGELNNTVIWGYSAKGHEGYLGCAVLGAYCNIGAGSSNSNLKNNWKTVSMYAYSSGHYRDTQLAKCGMIMGDLAMLGINSAVSTGTVIGVGAQVATSQIISKFVPDFMWMTDEVKQSYEYERFMDMLVRRNLVANLAKSENIAIFEYIYKQTQRLRDEVINT